MKKLPIGVFDSGLGGLTALAELHKLMPNEDIIYFGDNARIPYGTKSPEIIQKFALQDTRFLLSKGVKAILVACGTVSSNCLQQVKDEAGISVVGVIDSAAQKAAEIALGKSKKVAVLGTTATINSGAFKQSLTNLGVTEVIDKACPMFVPLVENWHSSQDDIATNAIVSEYLLPVAQKNPDAVILGCTHYPILAPVIKKYLPDARLISSGACAANQLKKVLEEKDLINTEGGKIEFFTSGGSDLFRNNASIFFDDEIQFPVEHVDIEKF